MVDARVDEVVVSAGTVPYIELGDPAGPTVVALSGLSDGLAPVTDDRARRALPELPRPLQAFRLVVVSYRSPLPPELTTATLAVDVAETIETICQPPVAVTGHSMGGMVAQHLAASRPDLVSRVVLSATSATAGDHLREVVNRWDRFVTAGRWRAFYRDAIDTSYTGPERWKRRLLLRLGDAPDASDRVQRHLALSSACRTHDASGALARISCPALVLAGELDPVVPVAESRRLADALPQAGFELFAGMAHGFPEQGWRRYVARLSGFVAGERTAT